MKREDLTKLGLTEEKVIAVLNLYHMEIEITQSLDIILEHLFSSLLTSCATSYKKTDVLFV